MFLSYFITSTIFVILEIIIDYRSISLGNILITFLFPFYGFPKFQFERKNKKSKRIIFNNIALANALFSLILLIVATDALTKFGDFFHPKTSPHENPTAEFLDLGVQFTIDAVDSVFSELIRFIVKLIIIVLGLFGTTIPLILSVTSKE